MVRRNPVRALFLFAIVPGPVLLGLALVLANSPTSRTGGGCFFWPFPVIILCGAGSSGTVYPLIIAGLVVTIIISFISFFQMRRSTTGPDD